MDNGYTWNECYVKINEMYKENLNLRESIGRLETKLSQAQTMIDELERLKIAHNTIIKSLNSAVSEQREMIDRLRLVEDAHKQLIASQRNYINVLTKKLRDSTEKLNDLTIINQTQRSIIFDQKDVIDKQYNIINSIWTNRNTILGIPKVVIKAISDLIEFSA
jgi:uncharacterized coiled-coil protein SlyX|nr:MAG TPA: hypothetical protein [Caudoviricetes sp.]